MSFRSLGLLAVLAAVLCIGSTAGADTIIYQEGADTPFIGGAYEGVDDNTLLWLSHTAGNYQAGQHELRNYGKSPSLGTGISGTDDPDGRTYKYKGLIRFDVTSLAGEYASIDSVKLRLYVTDGNVDHANSLQLFRFTAANGDWLEGPSPNGMPYPPTHSASCWNYRAYNTTPWDSGTAGTDLTDYESGTIATTAYSSAATGWMELVFTDLSFIDDWVTGAVTNPGMALRAADESKYSWLSFHSSEYMDDASLRPQLVIGYTPIPEPGTLALLATGLIGLLCYAWRKRK